MCHNVKTIAKNINGNLSFCEDCEVFHLTFNNFYIELSKGQMEEFKDYIAGVDIEYWESKYDSMPIKRKIVVNTQQQNLSILFNREELYSFKELLFEETKKADCSLSVLDIDYTLFLN